MSEDRAFNLKAERRFQLTYAMLYPAEDLYPNTNLYPMEHTVAGFLAEERGFALEAEHRFDETVLLVTIGCPLYPGCPLFPGCRTYPMLRAE